MRAPIFSRGLLTDWLIERLERDAVAAGSSYLVGDGIAPPAGGWTEGQPGQGKFTSYVVVTAAETRVREPQTLAHGDTTWVASYALRFVGGSRAQLEWVGDRVRAALVTIHRERLDLEGPWTIEQVRLEAIGGTRRIDTVDPAYWESGDTVGAWLVRTQ